MILGIAVLLDAFLVRLLLLPVFLRLSGRAAWYLPGWLDRALPRVHFGHADGQGARPPHSPRPAIGQPSPRPPRFRRRGDRIRRSGGLVKRVVILGGGSGGAVAGKRLGRWAKEGEFEVVLIDRSRWHEYRPSYLWVMTGKREPEDVRRELDPHAPLRNRSGRGRGDGDRRGRARVETSSRL